MPNTKYNPTPISSYYAPDLYCAGDIPMPHHSFEDFAMPPVYALMHYSAEFDVHSARIYTPNPWYPTEIRFYGWMRCEDGIWRKTRGGALTINAARDDWKSRIARGNTPRDVIANPLNGEEYEPWDAFAFHFCSHGTYGFHELIRSYKFDYPRKAK